MTSQLIKRYLWLIDTIHRAGKISFEEINERWKRCSMSEGNDLPLRTFHNHRAAIEDLFDIVIDCTRQGGYRYYIRNDGNLQKDAVNQWLLEAFAVGSFLNEGRSMQERILLERIPSGRRFLTLLIEAMRLGVQVELTYQSFSHDHASTFPMEPYALKLFHRRWYVVGRSPVLDELRVYAFDRFCGLELTDRPFRLPDDFDAATYFADSYGVIADPTVEPATIRLKAYGTQALYLQALPLHDSQRTVAVTDSYTLFELCVKPTYDFYQELLSHGPEVEVTAPAAVRREMGRLVAETARRYRIADGENP